MGQLSESDTEGSALGQKRGQLLVEVLLADGLFATAFGFGGKVVEDWWFGAESEVCDAAYSVLLDDALNAELSDDQRKAYLEKQYQIAMSCADREIE